MTISRTICWSQDGFIAWCAPFGRHSGKEYSLIFTFFFFFCCSFVLMRCRNLSLSYPIFLCSFNFYETRVTLETPHTTPVRHLQWSPLSTGRFLLSADDMVVCIWQLGVRVATSESLRPLVTASSYCRKLCRNALVLMSYLYPHLFLSRGWLLMNPVYEPLR